MGDAAARVGAGALIDTAIARSARALRDAERVLVVTGAGISAESGIPTFRGAGGLWHGYRPEDLATPEAFARDPARVWQWYRWRAQEYGQCEPNPGHYTIAAMERALGPGRFLLATQNVDGLHRRAGNKQLVELHGSISQMRCSRCDTLEPFPGGPVAEGEDPVPLCGRCGARMRPHILWFGEIYWPGVLEAAQDMAQRCDVVLVVGTSAQVWPPVALALGAQRAGAFMIDVNPEATPLSRGADAHLVGAAGEVLPALWEETGL